MISLASSTSTPARLSPEPVEPRPANTDPARAKGGFSAVLAQHEPQAAETQSDSAPALQPHETAETPEAETAHSGAPRGMAEPETAKTGKTLPVALPDLADHADAEAPAVSSDQVAAQAAAETMLAAMIVPQAPVPAVPGLVETTADTGAEASAPGKPARAAHARAALPQPLPGQVPPPAEGEARATGGKSNGAAVALQVAPQPSAQVAEMATDTPAESDTPTAQPRATAIERAAAQPATADAARTADFASLAVAAPSAPAPALTTSGDVRLSPQADALQDLTRIVDRLAAAREVFAPATEALSIDHAEFGELSLRFDQRRDGSLSVQLSASSPDAHRAVAQAVSAQAFHSAADGQPSQSQSQGQAQTAARGGTADREGASADGNAAHRDQPAAQDRNQRRPAPQPARPGQQPAGIFA
jgi:hypothetical protein